MRGGEEAMRDGEEVIRNKEMGRHYFNMHVTLMNLI